MSTQTKKSRHRLLGKVAQLLNERELVINIGESNGVRVGMKFKILADAPVEIVDPETNEPLGIVDREKVRVEAIDVQDKFAICQTYRTRYIAGSALYEIMAASSSLTSAPRRVAETLKAEDSEYLPPLSEEESYVKRGDRVVELTESEA